MVKWTKDTNGIRFAMIKRKLNGHYYILSAIGRNKKESDMKANVLRKKGKIVSVRKDPGTIAGPMTGGIPQHYYDVFVRIAK